MVRWSKDAALTPSEAMRWQERMARRVVREFDGREVRLVAGVDVGVRGERACAAIVVMELRSLRVVEQSTAARDVEFPYVPGLLGFREVPCVLAAFAKLASEPDVLLVDGHGLAHPRRFGVATHLGIELDRPAVGCAKSVLVGAFREPSRRRGASTRLVDRGETIGRALRTRDGVAPVYVSIGHRIDLELAERLVLRLTRGFRLPEPIRAAHRLAARG